jgi:hypothetical protein
MALTSHAGLSYRSGPCHTNVGAGHLADGRTSRSSTLPVEPMNNLAGAVARTPAEAAGAAGALSE